MKIAFDVHGTIDQDPEFFMNKFKLSIKLGMSIYIISGPTTSRIETELTELGLEPGKHYNKILSIVDFLQVEGVKLWQDENQNWWCDDYNWWSSKGRLCLRHNIDIMVDNEIRYKKYFNLNQCKFIHWKGSEQWKQIS